MALVVASQLKKRLPPSAGGASYRLPGRLEDPRRIVQRDVSIQTKPERPFASVVASTRFWHLPQRFHHVKHAVLAGCRKQQVES